MIERIEINLLPAEYRVHRKQFQIKREVAYPLMIAAIIGLVILLVSLGLQNSLRISHNELKAIQQSINQNRPIQNEINQLQVQKRTIEQKIKALEMIDVNREKWVRLMEELSKRLPPYTWISSVKEVHSTPPSIHIDGRTHSFPEVANFMSNLTECKYILSVDLSRIEQISSSDRLFTFAISCALNTDAYLDTPETAASSKGAQP